MSWTTRFRYWLVIVVVLIAVLILVYIRQPGQKPAESRPVPVEVAAVGLGPIEETIEMTGWIKANQVVEVASKVSGRVESLQAVLEDGRSVPVEEGLIVKKGQHLAVIDHDIYLAEANAARANVQALQVALADAQREKERISALLKGGSATQQSLDKAETAAAYASAQLDAAKANLELAEINVRESTIVSPIDGIITARHIDQGNLIKTGERLVTIEDINTVKIIIASPEKYAEKIRAQTPARIKVDSIRGRVFEAGVFSVWPSLDEQTHTAQVEIRLNNGQMLLKSGMFARVTLVTAAKNDAVVLPKDIVMGGKVDRHYVYVVNNSTAHKQLVEVGITQADKCEITDGLKPGEMVVVNGMTRLADGLTVEIIQKQEGK